MNKAESERLGSYLDRLGYQLAPKIEEADLIILNSCVVRQSAEDRVINKLYALKAVKKLNPGVVIALTGCLVSPDLSALRRQFPFIDHYFRPGEFPEWLGEKKAELSVMPSPQVATYVPIMQGCNNFCSYCIVPYRRGREKSRTLEDILCEVKELVRRGTKEVTLLGQNVDSFGNDLPGKPDLAGLLHDLNFIEGLLRLRFLTNHPKDMKSRLIEAVAGLDKVCEQINLPIQSGDNEILKAMRRGYSAENYRDLIREIRAKIPHIALSTDIIVGFPGESDRQFQNTFDLLQDIRFDMVHVAAYSPREGTMAARELQDDIPAEVKKERLDRIEKLQAEIINDINSRLLDQTVEVLVEGHEKGKWQGRTRTDKLVFFSAAGDFRGKLVQVKIDRAGPWSLSGIPVE
jgi:tRNA-2-methylthio-N6-dimethylallyladenosine synthase